VYIIVSALPVYHVDSSTGGCSATWATRSAPSRATAAPAAEAAVVVAR
jgi:hypothetical protein